MIDKKIRIRPKEKDITGFTLTEVMAVVVLIGILSTIAVARYIRVVEKGRSSEARHILGLLRDAEITYRVENNCYTNNLASLNLNIPAACNASFYFRYGISVSGFSYNATATRCTAGGKQPQGQTDFVLNLTDGGIWSATAGFL